MEDWQSTIAELVERVMVSVLGSSGKDAVLHHLRKMGISTSDATQRPAEFMEALHGIFDVGAEVFETLFVDAIKDTVGIAAKGRRLRDVVENLSRLHRVAQI